MGLSIPKINTDASTLDAALAYATAGWYVGPAKRGTKHPGSVIGDENRKHWERKTSRDHEVITSWFAGTDDGLFLHAGRSGGLAFDVDDIEKLHSAIQTAIEQYRPPFQSTRADQPGRGHYLFAQPPGRDLGNSLGKLGGGWGEIRGRNGVVMVAPSEHASGGRYQWVTVGPVPELPGYVASQLPDALDASETATDGQVTAFLAAHDTATALDGVELPGELLGKHVRGFRDAVAKGESRHGSMVGHLAGAMKEAAAGVLDAKEAADTLEAVFLPAVAAEPTGKQGEPRTGAVAVNEWRGMLAWAVAQTKGSNPAETVARLHEKFPDWSRDGATREGKRAPRVGPVPTGVTVEQVHTVFRRWLGLGYDLDALDVVLSVAAVEGLDGDPVWLLMVSGPGNAKTETVAALVGAGGHVTSTITSEGALLSATAKRDVTKDATGGLLRKIGTRGVVVLKDFTSIISMNRDSRAQVLAALREVFDGHWERNVGADGGRTLRWEGRIVLIGAVTSEYDRKHEVIASMGDRFALVRVDSTQGREASGMQALRNVGHEVQMRAELAEAVGGLLLNPAGTPIELDERLMVSLLTVANVVTLTRTAVEKDYQGNVVQAHAPEAPTRFTKMLGQIVRGATALGMPVERAEFLAVRVAADSLPPVRQVCLLAVHAAPQGLRLADAVVAVQQPRTTVDRALQELHVLGLLHKFDTGAGGGGWHYTIAADINRHALDRLRDAVTRKVSTPGYTNKEGEAA